MLKQENRLRRRQDFRRVYNSGKSLKNPAFVLCYRPAYKKGGLRIGFSVSKKIGKAVERNRTKRMMREACRLEIGAFPKGYDYILVARHPAKEQTVESLRRSVRKSLDKLSLKARNK